MHELLSALIGSISLIPFIISSGTGAEIEKPLAIVVVGGLVTRPLKIVILPMVYEWVESARLRRTARLEQATPRVMIRRIQPRRSLPGLCPSMCGKAAFSVRVKDPGGYAAPLID